jgi:hypothetical protein
VKDRGTYVAATRTFGRQRHRDGWKAIDRKRRTEVDFDDDLGVASPSQGQYIPSEFDVLVKSLDHPCKAFELASKLVARLGRCFFRLTRLFVSETLELGELEVEGSVRVQGGPPGPQ